MLDTFEDEVAELLLDEIGTLRRLASIKLKIKNCRCDSRGCGVQKLGPGDRNHGEINKTQMCERGVNQIFQPLRKSVVVWPNYTLCRELACRPPPPPPPATATCAGLPVPLGW